MTVRENTIASNLISMNAPVSILDESLFTGEAGPARLLCSVDPEFISVAVVDEKNNRFSGFEGFHFPKPLLPDQLTRKVAELAQLSAILKKVDFNKAGIQISGSRFTLIPSALFRPEDAEKYFYFNHQRLDGEAIRFEPVRPFDAVNIFAVPAGLLAAFKNLFEQFTVHHELSSLMLASAFSAPGHEGKNIFIQVHATRVEVIVTDARRLLFANSFSCKAAEDMVYFALMVCTQLSLDPEKIPVKLYGEIDKDALPVQQLKKYFRKLSFGERTGAAGFTYGFEDLPSHYYHAAFSQILCES